MKLFTISLALFLLLTRPALAGDRPLRISPAQSCRDRVDAAITQIDGIPWYLTGRVRSSLTQDVKDVRQGTQTIEQAGTAVYDRLVSRGMDAGWARYLSRRYREELVRLVGDQAC